MKKRTKQLYSDEIQKLYDVHNCVTPSKVLTTASDPNNVLHNYFEWDNTKAANEHRLNQARSLIRTVIIRTEENNDGENFWHIPSRVVMEDGSKEGEYKPLSAILKSQSSFERTMNEVSGMFKASKLKLEALTNAAENEDNVALLSIVLQSLHTAESALSKIH